MSELDLQPMLARPVPDQPAQVSRRWALLGAAAVLTAAAATVHIRAAMPEPDTVAAAEVARRTTALSALGLVPLPELAIDKAAAALEQAGMPADGRAAVLSDLQAGRARMVLVSFYDSDAEDGDVAEVRSSGFSQVVRLTKAPITLAVPVGPDNIISVAGLVDGGGGGVTVGLVLPSGPFALPPLSVGQVLRIPVRPSP